MRKYQQLLLLIISCISVGVLLMYKSENNHLKDVLEVINFFGHRSDVLKKVESNATYIRDFEYPLAVWQALGTHFHGYSAYWRRNELVSGGDAVAIVVGRKGAVLNFKCYLNFGGPTNIQGKFRFQRIDKNGEDDNSEFTRYYFYCKVTRDFGTPKSVVFNEPSANNKNGYAMKLRMVKVADKGMQKLAVHHMTVCLDFYNKEEFYNMTTLEKQPQELLEFFIHHYILGVEDFIVYSGDDIPYSLRPILQRFNVRVHLLPFNFPFSSSNSSERIRDVIEMDCLLRNINRASHSVLLNANEFFYPNTHLDDEKSVLRSIRDFDSSVTHFGLKTFAICKDQRHKYLIENTLYDPEVKTHRLSLYRPQDNTNAVSVEEAKREELPMSKAFVHRYMNCLHVGKDGLHDWRNSLREDFMQHLERLREEIKLLI
ncbi:uncharacterized protein LOC133336447 [Musca vetustissima]|uniref:uncharacterized protein LOC133336447 n=1 Tax=Musca vetustissima TaxID=27455 RepID=UPI002AB7ABA5|nr:uncharacterized protein LOC133336447 [Musca vetustissima]